MEAYVFAFSISGHLCQIVKVQKSNLSKAYYIKMAMVIDTISLNTAHSVYYKFEVCLVILISTCIINSVHEIHEIKPLLKYVS